MPRTLVSYGTTHGSTEEVARFVAKVLRDAGHEVECVHASWVTDLSSFDSVVLGGPIYLGHWHRDARRFVRRHHDALERIPFAVFALGPLALDEDAMAGSRRQLGTALARLDIATDFDAVFGGAVDPATLPFPLKRMGKKDARNWEAIRDWATLVAHRFPHPSGLGEHVHA